ncbi:TetR/AcrR family transcriptional regulator [Demequina gelatinilytica]|uniref:TetR/AcrR family transcriptional regulator n=1 Tax=Demequina gelatinilytica TaxID=1638980 RepID=UPI0009E5CEF9|nr:TetR/AcrR family transcriptional regulator [Demequina gelatinilytica]
MVESSVPDLRTRLLESALSLVAESGASALTVRAVAKAAGCSTMGVYTHFSGKSGLIDAIVDSGFDALDEQAGLAWERAEAGRDGLIAVAEAYRTWALENPTQFQTMFAPGIAGYDPSDATRERMWDVFYAHRSRVASVLDSADGDPAAWHQAAMAMWSCVHGHVAIELLRVSYATPEIAAYPASDLTALIDAQIAAAEVAAAR